MGDNIYNDEDDFSNITMEEVKEATILYKVNWGFAMEKSLKELKLIKSIRLLSRWRYH